MTKLIKFSPLDQDSWQDCLSAHPEANFLQTEYWLKVNRTLKFPVIAEHFEQNFFLAIVKSARRGRYLEVPAGPIIDWSDSAIVSATFARLRTLAIKHRCVFIRFRPQLPDSSAVRADLALLGARLAPMHLHAEHTVIIDLTQSLDDLMKNFRRQTRYEVRRADKLQLNLGKSNSEATFRLFHELQTATAARQHFIPPSLDQLLAIRTAFGDQAMIYLAATDSAFSKDSLIALGLVIHTAGEAEYFEAASTDLNRKLPGAHALQWFIMQDLKRQGIKSYNLWGIAPAGQPHHRYAGVTTFKTGFGGDIVTFTPAHDIVISRSRYLINLLVEKIRKRLRHL